MSLRFLQGGGEMGERLRASIQAPSPLGSPLHWPAPLRTLVSVMLHSPQPMFLAWGEAQRMVYNDAYAALMGRHHPAVGQPFFEVWAEVADDVGPIMARAYGGEPTFMDDIGLVLMRHGRPEEAHFSFFYTPVRGDAGDVAGVFCACTEITGQVMSERRRVAELSRLREMFAQSPSAVAVLHGPEHRLAMANPAFHTLAGVDELTGRPLGEALPHWAGQGLFEPLHQVLNRGAPFRAQGLPLRTPAPGGAADQQRHVDLILQPLRDDEGRVTGVFVELQDVSSAHAQARVLRDSEAKFRTFTQVVPNHVWTAPADGQLDWFNDQTLNYTGCSLAELAGDGWVRLVHPDDVVEAARSWAQSLASSAPYEVEFRIRRADGAYRWHLVRAQPMRGEGGQVLRWVGTNTDIDDQRADREALRALNATLERRVEERTRERERIWRNSPDLMVVLRSDGVLAEVNPAWTTILGWTPAQLQGQPMDVVVLPEDLALAQAVLVRATQGVLPHFECRLWHADGSHRSVSWTAAPEGDEVFAFGRDITPNKLQQEALAQAEEQLRQSQKMEAIGQLTGGIAHDFNNMLASISGAVQLMQRKLAAGRTENFDQLLDRAAASTQRAAALTQRLLAFARRQALDICRVDVAQLVRSMADMFERALEPRAALQIALAPELWCACIDAPQLENALLNLVINARDAMPEGGRLRIEAGNAVVAPADDLARHGLAPGDYVRLQVIDNGTGMPASVIARACEPFFTTKPIGQGTGLGLSMVYGFVKQAGGHVQIDSAPGQGTTVQLYLPRDLSADGPMPAGAQASAADQARPASQAEPTGGPGRGGQTVLVVEDEADVRAVIVAVIEQQGYHQLAVADAEAALAILHTAQPVHLLVSDVGLPGLNGRQLAEMAIARRPGLKVLFVTGYAEQATQGRGTADFLEPGMQMISKPFALDVLAQRVQALLALP